MIKRFFVTGLLLFFSTSLFLLPGDGVEASDEVGYIYLDEARNAHPLGGELEFLEKKYSDYEKTLSNLYQQQSFVAELIGKHEQQVEKRIWETREKIEQEYKGELGRVSQELQEKYGPVEFEIEEQARKKIAEFERELQKRYQEKISEHLGQFNQEYREFREGVRGGYSFEIFNLRLQLQMAQLTDEERTKKEEQLQDLENQKEEALRQKEMEISWAMRTISFSLQLEIDKELASFVAEKEQEVQRQLENLMAEKEEERNTLVAELEEEKEEKMETREGEIRENSRENIARGSQQLNQELIEQVERIHGRMNKLEGEINSLERRIMNDISALAEQISREKGLKVEIIDVLANEAGIDLTPRLIEMLE